MVPIEKHVGQPIFVIHFPGICAISNSNCTKIQLSQGKNAKLLLEWSPAFSSLALCLEEQVLQPKAACWHVYTIIWIFQCCSIDWIVAAPQKNFNANTRISIKLGEFASQLFLSILWQHLSQLHGNYLIFQADLANIEAPSKCFQSQLPKLELWNSEQKLRDDEINIKCVCLKTVHVYCIPPIHDENYDLLWDLGVPEVQTNPSYRGN